MPQDIPLIGHIVNRIFGTRNERFVRRYLARVEEINALEPKIRNTYMADSTLTDSANLLICPNIDAANILYNVLKTTTSGGVTVGPILMGAAATAYILTPAATVRRVLNMTALAVASAAARPN